MLLVALLFLYLLVKSELEMKIGKDIYTFGKYYGWDCISEQNETFH